MENIIVLLGSSENGFFYIPAGTHTYHTKKWDTIHGSSERPETKLHLYKCTFGALLVTAENSFSFIQLILSFFSEEVILEHSRTALIAAVGKNR